MEIGERIKEYRIRLGLGQDELAAKCGISGQSIHRYESGKSNPREVILGKLARIFGISVHELKTGEKEKPSIDLEPVQLPTNFVRINVYGTVPAGMPTEAIENIVDEVYIDEKMTRGGKEFIGLKVKGDSMYPRFLDGDTIVIEKTPDFNNGDIIVVYVDNYEATLKQGYRDGNILKLHPINPEWQDREYNMNKIDIQVLGVVRQLIRSV